MEFEIQDVYNWDSHNSEGYSNEAIIQGVYPVKLPWDAVPLLVTRTTLPYVTTPDLGPGVNRKTGLGDLVTLGLFTPRLKSTTSQLGLGYTLTLPTAGDNEFVGAGKWQAGPSFLYINKATKGLQWGLLGWQSWSFADAGKNREDVSELSLEPFAVIHFKKGWYIATPDTPQVYDFKSDKWTWALGGNIGRVMKLGKRPVTLYAQILNNPEDDNGPSYNWQFKFNVTLLFPK